MTKRDRTVIAVVLALALVVGAWMLVIQPRRQRAAKLGSQLSTVQSELSQAKSQVAKGEAARAAFGDSYTVLARLGEAVPADDNVPSLIYQIQSAASKAGVDFSSLTLTSTAASSSTNTSSSATQSTLPPGATVGAAGFPIEPFSFTFNGNFFHLSDFFGRLERFVMAGNRNISVSGRLMTLDGITLAPGPGGFPNITATISATTYLLPANEGLTAGATPLGPGAQSVSTAASPAGAGSSSSAGTSTPPAAVVAAPVR